MVQVDYKRAFLTSVPWSCIKVTHRVSDTKNDVIHCKELESGSVSGLLGNVTDTICSFDHLNVGLCHVVSWKRSTGTTTGASLQSLKCYTPFPHSSSPPAHSAKSFPLVLSSLHLSATLPSVSSLVRPCSSIHPSAIIHTHYPSHSVCLLSPSLITVHPEDCCFID